MAVFRARAIAAAMASVALVVSLGGCAYLEQVDAGQKKLDRAIADAGLASEVQGEYSCTGSLPFQADTCSTHLDIQTDDLAVLERTAEVPELSTADVDVDLVYRGVEFHTVPTGADDVRRFEPYITDELLDADVTATAESAQVKLDTAPGFQRLCDLATSLNATYSSARVGSSRASSSTGYWTVEAVAPEKPALFAPTCALLDTFVADFGMTDGLDYVLYQTDRDRVLLSTDVRGASEKDAAGRRTLVEDWVSSHDIPEGLQVDIY